MFENGEFKEYSYEEDGQTYAGQYIQEQMRDDDFLIEGVIDDPAGISYSLGGYDIEPITHAIVGNTGTGKTNFVQNNMIQLAYKGYGFFYSSISYMNSDMRRFVQKLPAKRLDDVVYASPEQLNEIDFEEVVEENKIVLYSVDESTGGDDVTVIEDAVESIREASDDSNDVFGVILDGYEMLDVSYTIRRASAENLSMWLVAQNPDAIDDWLDIWRVYSSSLNHRHSEVVNDQFEIDRLEEIRDVDAYDFVTELPIGVSNIESLPPFPVQRSEEDAECLIEKYF